MSSVPHDDHGQPGTTRLRRAAIAAACLSIVLSGCSRDEDYSVRSSKKISGTQIFSFTSNHSPAMPDNASIAADFQPIFRQAGIDVPGASADVQMFGSRSVGWVLDDGTKITISRKQCSDDVSCIDKVVVMPPTKQQLINKAKSWDNAKFIEEKDYSPWPFTISHGILRCEKAGAVTIQNDREVWYLNGMGKAWVSISQDMRKIQKPDTVTGGYQFNSKILSDGLALCN